MIAKLRRRSVAAVIASAILIIAAMVWMAHGVAGARNPAAAPVSRMAEPVPEFALQDATFEQALDALRFQAKLNILVDPGLLKDFKRYARLRRVTLSARGLDGAAALRITLAAYEDNFIPLGYSEDEAGVISLFEAAHDSYGRRRDTSPQMLVYDITDFVDRFVAPNVPPPGPQPGPRGIFSSFNGMRWNNPPDGIRPTAIQALQQQVTWPSGQVSHLDREECVDTLIRLIEETVDPNSWRDNGGQIGNLREIGGLLVVEQTASSHDGVQKLLRDLRRLRDDRDAGRPPSETLFEILSP